MEMRERIRLTAIAAQAPILDKWDIELVNGGRVILVGKVYGDTRWEAGTSIRTSSVTHSKGFGLAEGDVIKTRNSTYVLGFRKEF